MSGPRVLLVDDGKPCDVFELVELTDELVRARTPYLFEIVYDATQIRLLIDGVTQITVAPGGGIDFLGDTPGTANWGSRPGGDLQMDAVFANP